MLKKLLLEVAVAIFLVGILSVPRAIGASSVNVPLGDWSYEALEKLAGFGLLESDIVGTRPYSRAEVARLVLEALRLKAESGKEISPLAEYLLERFQKEYRDELASLGSGVGNTAKTYLKPIERLQVGYVYSNGVPRQFVGFPGINADIQATEGTPLVYNNEGVIYGEHNNFTVQVSSILQYRDIASAYVEPILLARQDKGNFHDYDKVELDLLKGYGKISPWSMELEGGRDSLWWGQGYHGNLLLTNNGTPLDLVKLSNPSPILLPWFLSYLGPFKYNFFLSVLEEDRVVPHPWFAGIRFEIKPFPIFEMGITTTVMFNGEGQPKLTFSEFLGLLVFQAPGGKRREQEQPVGCFGFSLALAFSAQCRNLRGIRRG